MHRNAQECTIHMCIVHTNAPECTGMHRSAQKCTKSAQKFSRAQTFTEVYRFDAVSYGACTVVCLPAGGTCDQCMQWFRFLSCSCVEWWWWWWSPRRTVFTVFATCCSQVVLGVFLCCCCVGTDRCLFWSHNACLHSDSGPGPGEHARS